MVCLAGTDEVSLPGKNWIGKQKLDEGGKKRFSFESKEKQKTSF